MTKPRSLLRDVLEGLAVALVFAVLFAALVFLT